MHVYIIVNNANLKIYVGKTISSPLSRYLKQKFCEARRGTGRRSHLYNAIRKHGEKNFSIYPLVSGLPTNDDLIYWERLLIKSLKSQHPDVGYNICDGGEGVLGRPVSPETRAKIGAANAITAKGRVKSEETRAKMAAVMKGRKTSKGMFGRKHSEETLAKMRESARNRETKPITEEHRRHMSEARKGHRSYTTPEGIKKMSAAKKGKPWSPAQRAGSTNPNGSKLTGAQIAARYRANNRERYLTAKRNARFLKTVAWG